jgi:ectoine hydroxylase
MGESTLKQEFDCNGYVVIDKFFEDKQMDHIDRLIHKHFGENPNFQHNDEFLNKSQTDVIPWFPLQEGVSDFDAIEGQENFRGLSEAILGAGWYEQSCMVMFSRQGSLGQAWHQDCPPEDSECFNLNRLVYTSDITDETGGQVVVVPGSHKMGLLPAGDPVEALAGQVVLRPRKGSLILLHGHAWHCVLPIQRGVRVSVNYRAASAGTSEDVTDICVYRNMRYQFSTARVLEERVG